MSFGQENLNADLIEIEQEINEIQLDLQSNTDSILVRPIETKPLLEKYLFRLDQNNQKLQFFRRSNPNSSKKIFSKISELEKKMAVLKNQIEINLKMLKKL